MRVLQWKTCLRAGVTVALVYLAIHYWGPVSAALGVDVILLALLDAALWLVLTRKASVTYCLREYTK